MLVPRQGLPGPLRSLRPHPFALVAVTLCASIIVQDALAQQVLPEVRVTPSPEAFEKLPLDTVSGTGSRLGLTVRETPASVTIIDRASIEKRDARSTQEALIAAPGLHASPTNAPPGFAGYVMMRGFSGSQVQQTFNGISVQYDAVAARPIDSWLLDRVEVLGGPSSYLYGSGAVGGTINYVSKVATREALVQDAYAAYGSFNTARVAYGINVALGGPDAGNWVRLDVSRAQSDGYVNPGRSNSNAVAFSWLSDIAPGLTHTLAIERADEQRLPYWGTPLLRPATAGTIDPATARINYNVADGLYGNQILWGRSITEWQAGAQTRFTNTLYHYDAERVYRNVEVYRWNAANTAIERGALLATRHGQSLWGDKVEFAHRSTLFGRDSTWAGGIDLSVNHQTRYPLSSAGFTATTGTALDTVNPYGPNLRSFFTVLPGAQDATNPDRENTVRSRALFIENRTRLGGGFSLVTGLRNDRIHVAIANRRAATATDPASYEITYRATTGRAGLMFDLSPTANLYVQYSTAADPPAGVLTTGTFAQLRDFPLTTGTQWEAGSKFDFWDRLASATVAAYRIVRRNLSITDPANPAGPPVAVGQQSASGIEAGVGARLSRDWRIQANAGYVEPRFDKLVEAGGVSRTGNLPPNTPKLTANLWLTWGGLRDWEIGGWWRHVGSTYADNANTVSAPGYQLLDLFASHRVHRNATLTLRVRNATDRLYVSNATGAPMFILGEPRSIEASVRATF